MKLKEHIAVIAMAVLIVAVTVIAFFPSMSNAFSGGDEEAYITKNPLVASGWGKALTSLLSPSFYREQKISYTPAVVLTFGTEYAIFEDNPSIFHGTNLILHIANCLLAFFLLFLLCRNLYISFIAAILFALHPMKAEAVASLSGRPVLLMSFFYILSLICYVRYLTAGRKVFLWLSFTAGALSMLSSPSGMSLPLVLFALSWMMKSEDKKASVKEIYPFIGLSLLTVLLTVLANGGFIKGIYPFSFSFPHLRSLCLGSYTLILLLGKLIIPAGLSTYYAYPDETHLSAFLLLSPLLAGVLVFLCLYASLRWRETAPGFILFLIPLLPFLHLFLEYETLTKDMYTYLPSLGLFYLAGFIVVEVIHRSGNYRRAAAVIAASLLLAVVIVYSVMTGERCALWADRESLQRDMEAHIPRREIAELQTGEEREKAIIALSEKLKENKNVDVKLLTQRGVLYMQKGEADKALADFTQATKDRPDYAPAFYYRALMLSGLGLHEKALGDYEHAIHLDPSQIFVYQSRGNSHAAMGHTRDALKDYSHVIRNQPDNIEALINRGTVHGSSVDYVKAAADFDEVLRLNPKVPEALYRRAALEIAQGREKEAEQYVARLRSLTGDVDPQHLTSLVAAFRKKSH